MIKYPTYFVDIDGTLVKYRKFTEINEVPLTPIQSVIDKVNNEYDNGAHIVITTARPVEFELFTKQELEKIGVKYHQLILAAAQDMLLMIETQRHLMLIEQLVSI